MGMKFVIFIFSIAFLFSCQNDNKLEKINATTIDSFVNKTSFSNDLLMNKSGSPDYMYSAFNKQLELYKIKRIDTLVKNFTIRIFRNFDKSGAFQSLALEFIDNHWEGKFNKYKNSLKDTIGSNKEVAKDSSSVTPRNGWDKFIYDIFSNDLLYLSSMNKLKNFNIDYAGEIVFIEIAAKDKYRFYYYYAPEFLANSCDLKECKEVVQIFKIIDDNFILK